MKSAEEMASLIGGLMKYLAQSNIRCVKFPRGAVDQRWCLAWRFHWIQLETL